MNTDSFGMKSVEDTEEIEILHNIFGKSLLYKINTPFLEDYRAPQQILKNIIICSSKCILWKDINQLKS